MPRNEKEDDDEEKDGLILDYDGDGALVLYIGGGLCVQMGRLNASVAQLQLVRSADGRRVPVDDVPSLKLVCRAPSDFAVPSHHGDWLMSCAAPYTLMSNQQPLVEIKPLRQQRVRAVAAHYG